MTNADDRDPSRPAPGLSHSLSRLVGQAGPVGKKRWNDLPPVIRRWTPVAYTALLLSAAAVNILILGIRLWSMLQFGGRLATTGGEGSGSLGVYEVCAHGALYHDYSHLPNSFVFNFIFYEFYGLLDRAFGPCVSSAPLVSRLLTLLFLAALAAALFWARGRTLRLAEALAISAAAFSPYVGWWAFAIRPDVGAMALFALSLIAMLTYLRAPSVQALLASCLLIFAAWGFKQTYLFAVPLMAAYIFRKNRRHAAIFVLLFAVGACIPLVVYGPHAYLLHTVAFGSQEPLRASVFLVNFKSFVVKASPMIAPAIIVAIAARTAPRQFDLEFLIAMLVFSAVVLGVAAAKPGANDNYWMPTFVVALLMMSRFAPSRTAPTRYSAFTAYAALSLLLGIAVLSGVHGRLTLDSPNVARQFEAAAAINQMPGPKLVYGDNIAAPWITQNVEARINFSEDITAHTAGGYDAAARIKQGYYATIAFEGPLPKSLDLSRYEREEKIGDIAVFARRR